MGSEFDGKYFEALVKEVVAVRKDKKITQQQVFDDIAIHVARIEQGKRNMAIKTLISLCTYYNIKPSDLFKRVEATLKSN